MAEATTRRLESLDVFRGLVMLVLIPDVYGAFSFYRMAELHPDDTIWSWLTTAFTHVQWTGCSLWDLVAPSFILIAGMSMPYSVSARLARGDAPSSIYLHAFVRAAALLVLDILLALPKDSYLDLLMPLVLISIGLPVGSWLSVAFAPKTDRDPGGLNLAWSVGALFACTTYALVNFRSIGGYEFHGILTMLGLAYLIALPIVVRSFRFRWVAALSILAVYWLAFRIYPLPVDLSDAYQFGVTSPRELFDGTFAHWNKGTNVAAAFDRWFLNLLPRDAPYVFNDHGYQVLGFIPVSSVLIFGSMVADLVRDKTDSHLARNGLIKLGLILTSAGIACGVSISPIVKSIWTPSWTLFSTGIVILVVAVLYHLIDHRGYRRLAPPFSAAGMNPLVLYVAAMQYRWHFLEIWRRVFGASIFEGYWQPVAESLTFGATICLLAIVMARLRIFIRL